MKLLTLDAISPLKSEFFLSRREFGTFNVGGAGKIKVDGIVFELGYKEALYLGAGNRKVTFESLDATNPANFYFNSVPAHKTFPDTKVTKDDAIVAEMGSRKGSNHRNINKMLVSQVLETCQLQMGMTELATGIFLHDGKGQMKVNALNGTIAFTEDAVSNAKLPSGRNYVGVLVPTKVNAAKSKGIHAYLLTNYRVGDTFTYYFGGGWSKWGYPTDEDWFNALNRFSNTEKKPLQVSLR